MLLSFAPQRTGGHTRKQFALRDLNASQLNRPLPAESYERPTLLPCFRASDALAFRLRRRVGFHRVGLRAGRSGQPRAAHRRDGNDDARRRVRGRHVPLRAVLGRLAVQLERRQVEHARPADARVAVRDEPQLARGRGRERADGGRAGRVGARLPSEGRGAHEPAGGRRSAAVALRRSPPTRRLDDRHARRRSSPHKPSRPLVEPSPHRRRPERRRPRDRPLDRSPLARARDSARAHSDADAESLRPRRSVGRRHHATVRAVNVGAEGRRLRRCAHTANRHARLPRRAVRSARRQPVERLRLARPRFPARRPVAAVPFIFERERPRDLQPG